MKVLKLKTVGFEQLCTSELILILLFNIENDTCLTNLNLKNIVLMISFLSHFGSQRLINCLLFIKIPFIHTSDCKDYFSSFTLQIFKFQLENT